MPPRCARAEQRRRGLRCPSPRRNKQPSSNSQAIEWQVDPRKAETGHDPNPTPTPLNPPTRTHRARRSHIRNTPRGAPVLTQTARNLSSPFGASRIPLSGSGLRFRSAAFRGSSGPTCQRHTLIPSPPPSEVVPGPPPSSRWRPARFQSSEQSIPVSAVE